MGGDDLPAPAPTYPRVCETIAATERSVRTVAAHDQPPGDDRRCTEAMNLHVLVVRSLDGVRSGHDIVQHGSATDGAIVLAIDETVRQESLKHCGIAPDQGHSPIVLQAEQHARHRVLGADALRSGNEEGDDYAAAPSVNDHR